MKHNWEYKRLGDVCENFIDGDWIESKDQSPNGFRLIQTGNVGNGVYLDKGERSKYISEDTFYRLKCTEIFEGDLLISRLPDPIGRACILPQLNERSITAVDCAIVRPLPIIITKFLLHYTRSKQYASEIDIFTKGSTRKRVSRGNLGKINIPIPPKETQERIVAELDDINALIEAKREQLKQLDLLVQSVFYTMFGDPVTNPKGWEMITLKSVCSHIVDCPHSTPKKSLVPTEFPCIRTSELTDSGINWSSMQYLDEDEYNKRTIRLKPQYGDLIYGREGTVGGCVMVPKGKYFSLGQRTMLFRPSTINAIFLLATFRSPWIRNQTAQKIVGQTVKHINIKDLIDFLIPFPPLSLQQQFATKFEAIEAQKAEIEETLKELQTLLDSRMDYWFN